MAKFNRKMQERIVWAAAETGYFIMALHDQGFDDDMIFAILHAADIRKAICAEKEALDAFRAFVASRDAECSSDV